MYRDMDAIPVLVSEGAIIPMYRDDTTNNLSLEQPLEIQIWRGNGSFDLYEDDGETNAYAEGKYAITSFKLEELGNKLRLTITPPQDTKNVLPEERKMYIQFRDVDIDEMEVVVGNAPVVIEKEYTRRLQNEDVNELKNNVLTRVQGNNNWKTRAFKNNLPKFVADVVEEFAAFDN